MKMRVTKMEDYSSPTDNLSIQTLVTLRTNRFTRARNVGHTLVNYSHFVLWVAIFYTQLTDSQGVFFSAYRRISADFPPRSVQIWGESRPICRGVCLFISTRNCPEMAKNCCFQPQKFTVRTRSRSLPEILSYLPDGGQFSWVPVLI